MDIKKIPVLTTSHNYPEQVTFRVTRDVKVRLRRLKGMHGVHVTEWLRQIVERELEDVEKSLGNQA